MPLLGRHRGSRRLATALLLLFAGARCTFPEYDIVRSTSGGERPAAGNAGQSSVAGSGAGGTTNGGVTGQSGGDGVDPQAGSDAGPGDGGGDAGGGEGGEPTGGTNGCVGEQWPVERCAADQCLPRYPEHCYDGDLSEDEIAVDCGGGCQPCVDQACHDAADCLSERCEPGAGGAATCYAPLSVSFLSHDGNSPVDNFSWKIRLRNEEPSGGQTFSLQDLKLRYYFKRAEVVEPLLVRSTQSDLFQSSGSRSLTGTSWSIQRVELVDRAPYDAYLEVGFDDAGRLGAGERIEIYQQLVTGWVGTSRFDQNANYSFPTSPLSAADAALHVSAFYRGKLVWGLEPAPENPRACFAAGVNLNGPKTTVGGVEWQSDTDANVATSGSPGAQSAAPFPAADTGTTSMLSTSIRLDPNEQLNLPADNATYLVYLYANSAGNAASPSSFTVQGVATEAFAGFRPQMVDGNRSAWARLGPFRADVTSGVLNVTATQGAIDFSGIELWYPN